MMKKIQIISIMVLMNAQGQGTQPTDREEQQDGRLYTNYPIVTKTTYEYERSCASEMVSPCVNLHPSEILFSSTTQVFFHSSPCSIVSPQPAMNVTVPSPIVSITPIVPMPSIVSIPPIAFTNSRGTIDSTTSATSLHPSSANKEYDHPSPPQDGAPARPPMISDTDPASYQKEQIEACSWLVREIYRLHKIPSPLFSVTTMGQALTYFTEQMTIGGMNDRPLLTREHPFMMLNERLLSEILYMIHANLPQGPGHISFQDSDNTTHAEYLSWPTNIGSRISWPQLPHGKSPDIEPPPIFMETAMRWELVQRPFYAPDSTVESSKTGSFADGYAYNGIEPIGPPRLFRPAVYKTTEPGWRLHDNIKNNISFTLSDLNTHTSITHIRTPSDSPWLMKSILGWVQEEGFRCWVNTEQPVELFPSENSGTTGKGKEDEPTAHTSSSISVTTQNQILADTNDISTLHAILNRYALASANLPLNDHHRSAPLLDVNNEYLVTIPPPDWQQPYRILQYTQLPQADNVTLHRVIIEHICQNMPLGSRTAYYDAIAAIEKELKKNILIGYISKHHRKMIQRELVNIMEIEKSKIQKFGIPWEYSLFSHAPSKEVMKWVYRLLHIEKPRYGGRYSSLFNSTPEELRMKAPHDREKMIGTTVEIPPERELARLVLETEDITYNVIEMIYGSIYNQKNQAPLASTDTTNSDLDKETSEQLFSYLESRGLECWVHISNWEGGSMHLNITPE